MVAAARKGDSHAQYLMGIRYYDGDGVRPNFDKAFEFFEKAARAKHAGALRELGRIYADFAEFDSTALRKAFDYYKQASDLGDASGAGHFAEMHRTGIGAPLRPDIAETYYLRAIELDPTFAAAYNNLSTIYEERLSGVRWNGGGSATELEALVLKNVGEAANRGLAVAKVNLGRFYLKGDIVPKDIEKAYLLFDEAAADGLAVAHYELAIMHEKGIGVPVTYSEALYHYRLAALEGHQSSLDKLIDSYTAGHGVEVDLDRAAFWLLKSIGTGDMIALITFVDVQLKLGNDKLAFSLLQSLEEAPSNLIAGAACERLSLC
jgi:TPR repeat protein